MKKQSKWIITLVIVLHALAMIACGNQDVISGASSAGQNNPITAACRIVNGAGNCIK